MRKNAKLILAAAVCLTAIAGCNFAEEQEVIVSVRSVSLDRTKEDMTIGGTSVLYATVLPENATDKSLKFTSSDPEVVKVDENGVITALKAGTAVITAQSQEVLPIDVTYEHKKATCTITVKDSEQSDFISLKLGADGKWSFDMLPYDYEIVVEYED
ncbi:MAG: Ig domain-containing protein [Bacteroidaceae bacterium]|nr:Ig domain-containing protein [Bacteroidaceae bacterium]